MKRVRAHQRAPQQQPQPAQFFKLAATYSIEPGASTSALLEDCRCLMESGVAVFDAMFEDLPPQGWAGLYTLRQACALLVAAIELDNANKTVTSPERGS